MRPAIKSVPGADDSFMTIFAPVLGAVYAHDIDESKYTFILRIKSEVAQVSTVFRHLLPTVLICNHAAFRFSILVRLKR